MKGALITLGVLLLAYLIALGVGLYYTGHWLNPALGTSDRVDMAAALGPEHATPDSASGRVRNVIFLLGDGMGTGLVHAARVASLGPDGRLAMEEMPHVGLVTTHPVGDLITDSAAGATALATGYKTRQHMVGMGPDSVARETILEAAQASGRATGLVTTSYLPDASPSAFATHAPSRYERRAIARQLVEAGVDVLLGGGLTYFEAQTQDQEEGIPVEAGDLLRMAADDGYRVLRSAAELRETGGRSDSASARVIGLFADEALDGDDPDLGLVGLLEFALGQVARDPEGFFLFVEQEHTDTQSHNNDLAGGVAAVLELDRAVKAALDFAARDGSTLVIVTADHETGGVTLVEGREGQLRAEFSTFEHTAAPVPIYAYGPGAHSFAGLLDNTDVPRRIARLMRLGPFPRAATGPLRGAGRR